MENWLTGVGFTSPFGEFLGDSTYVVAAHNSGISAVIIISLIYITSVYKSIIFKSQSMFLPLSALLMVGFALPTLFKVEGAMIISYVIYKDKK
jgi:hypothetical protein